MSSSLVNPCPSTVCRQRPCGPVHAVSLGAAPSQSPSAQTVGGGRDGGAEEQLRRS